MFWGVWGFVGVLCFWGVLGFGGVGVFWGFWGVLGQLSGVSGFGVFWGVLFFRVFGGFECLEVLWCLGVLPPENLSSPSSTLHC